MAWYARNDAAASRERNWLTSCLHALTEWTLIGGRHPRLCGRTRLKLVRTSREKKPSSDMEWTWVRLEQNTWIQYGATHVYFWWASDERWAKSADIPVDMMGVCRLARLHTVLLRKRSVFAQSAMSSWVWLVEKKTQVKAMRSNSSSGRKGGMRDTNNTGKQLDREKTETREGVNDTEKDDESLEKARAWWKDTMSYKDNGDKRDKCSEDAQARYRMRRERVCDGKAWQKAAGNRRAPLLQHIGARIQTPKDAARPHQGRKWSTYT